MQTISSIISQLRNKGSEQTLKLYSRHGIDRSRAFGVKVADLKVIAKGFRGQQGLACDLLATGNMDAMYLGGMIADGAKVSASQLREWAESAAGLQMIGEYTIPWLAVEHKDGRVLALEWIDSGKEHLAAAGWNTYGGLLAILPDAKLDLEEIRRLMDRVVKEIGSAPNRVRHCMNLFVISVGGYVTPLLKEAKAVARKVGTVKVDMGETACKVPDAVAYIAKMEAMGRIGKKRKTMRC